jgi:hypothetical protein
MMVMTAFSIPSSEPDDPSGSGAGATEAKSEPRLSQEDLRYDRLCYLADMIIELQVLASESHCTTLSGILSLAHAEARQQMNACRL